MKTLLCDCNRTMTLDRPAISRALAKTPGASSEGLEQGHTLLCRREAGSFQREAKATGVSGDELLVACTQESRLFLALNEQTEGAASVAERPIRFVNIRETAGWSRDGAQATPKIAALIAAAQLPTPEPVTTVTYRSQGRTLVVGPAAAAHAAAALLADKLDVSLLLDSSSPPQPASAGALPQRRDLAVFSGRLVQLRGWLGQFDARWDSSNPIDLDLCTRCNACVDACPEGAIDFSYQIDLSRCKSHRDCVRVCEAAGAIDFQRPVQTAEERFDLVLDLRTEPAFLQHQPPQGYFHVPGGDSHALMQAVLALRDLAGEFDKPKFFHYQQRLCAHSRNEQIGCTACIDVCSAQAVRSDATQKGKVNAKARGPAGRAAAHTPGQAGGGVVVEPHLCVGCGACTTVCPSGALSFTYPGPVDQGKRWRTILQAYTNAGGKDAALLLHSEKAGTAAIEALGRAARSQRRSAALQGLPSRVLPVPLWHTASTGIDLWLAAIAQGASQVWVLLTQEEAPQYRQALAEQMAVAQAILGGLGYRGEHLKLIEADVQTPAGLAQFDAALRAPAAQTVSRPAPFATQADKRATLDLAIDHLLAQAPAAQALPADAALPLPAAGSPFGSLVVDTNKCTLCLSCVGACPESALADNPDKPQLRFIEKNCVQCGLCEKTCPEGAIALQPRLWLADGGKARKAARVLHEAQPFQCVRCSKPFGTLRAIENMLEKLAGHAAFQGRAAERLKMCSDCRVIDMYSGDDEVKIQDIR